MLARSLLPLFMTAIRVYANCTVTVWEADSFGQITHVKATLYETLTTDRTIENPQQLDSEGKFLQPVYFDAPAIATIDGLTVGTHATGVMRPTPSPDDGNYPIGPAGGDLTGTYPDPTLVLIQAGGVAGDPTHTPVLSVDAKGRVTAITEVPISFPIGAPAVPIGPAGGDLTGTYPNPTIVGHAVSNPKLAQMADGTVKGRALGAGLGDVQDLTAAQLAAIIAPLITGAGIPIGTILDYTGPDLPPLFLWPNGQAVSRVTYAAYFAKVSTTYGPGDGSTTFNIPDVCGCVVAAMDNLGGIAAKGRLTLAKSGIDGTVLGARGGNQECVLTAPQMPVHAHGVTDPTHAHSLYDVGHAHSVYDPTHAHGIGDPTHVHPGTTVGTHLDFYGDGDVGRVAGSGFTRTDVAAGVGAAYTGVYTGAAGTGVQIYAAGTGMSVYGAATGIVVQNAGGGAAHPNVQATIVLNKILYVGV